MDKKKYQFVNLKELANHKEKKIWVSGRIHNIRRQCNLCFVIIRNQLSTLQVVVHKKNPTIEETFKEFVSLPKESVVDIRGTLVATKFPIEFTSYKDVELVADYWTLVSKSQDLPFQIDDANAEGLQDRSDVTRFTKLNHRWLDLRTPINNCIFKLQSGVVQLFREFLLSNRFMEIHSPKLLGVASECGAEVFQVKFFDRTAYLAQSPQLYKQMAINSDFERVFEIGPVFRAENTIGYRHLCEYVSLDLEMEIPRNKDYHFVTNLIWDMLVFIFDGLKTKYKKEVDTINKVRPLEELQYTAKPFILKYQEAVKMLNKAGFEQEPLEDLKSENEKALGDLVKEKYKTDLFMLDEYPLAKRPFYTMPLDKKYSRSYDFIMKGTEIISGAQREHNYEKLFDRIKEHKISPESLEGYLKSFSLGSKPHAGCGLGLERILMLYLNLGNVRRTSLCPRDPKRLFP